MKKKRGRSDRPRSGISPVMPRVKRKNCSGECFESRVLKSAPALIPGRGLKLGRLQN